MADVIEDLITCALEIAVKAKRQIAATNEETRMLQHADRMAREGNQEMADSIFKQVDSKATEVFDYGDVFERLIEAADRYVKKGNSHV